MPTRAHWTKAAAYVACRDDLGRLLLTRYLSDGPDSGRWTMPGGGMEWGETPEQTALRELEEETGLSARLGSVLGVFSQWFTATESERGEPGHIFAVIYEGVSVSGSLRTAWDLGTTDGAAWFTLDEARLLSRVRLVDFSLGLVS